MMEYCRLPRGEERLSTLGLGLCGRSRHTYGIQQDIDKEMRSFVKKAAQPDGPRSVSIPNGVVPLWAGTPAGPPG